MTMQAFVKENAIVVPQRLSYDLGNREDRFSHGIVSKNTDPPFLSHMRYGKPIINKGLQESYCTSAPIETLLDGQWLYGGGIDLHFGHFLSECIHRLWAWEDHSNNCKGVIFLPKPDVNPNQIPSFVWDIFGLFGLDRGSITFLTSLTQVEQLIIPEPGSQLGFVPSNAYLTYLDSFICPRIKYLIGNQPLYAQFHTVFVSRKAYKMNGRVAGLDALQRSLVDEGIEIFYPEEHSIKEQLSVFYNASLVIIEEGSSAHLYELFGSVSQTVILLQGIGVI